MSYPFYIVRVDTRSVRMRRSDLTSFTPQAIEGVRRGKVLVQPSECAYAKAVMNAHDYFEVIFKLVH